MAKHTVAVFRGDALQHLVELKGQDVRIGRSPENDLCLRDDGKAVSRFHAELRAEDDGYIVLDLNSQNGTWIEGERVTRSMLEEGRDVVIGPYRLVVREGEFAEGELPAVTVPPVSHTMVPIAATDTPLATQPVAQRPSPPVPALAPPAAVRKPVVDKAPPQTSKTLLYAGAAAVVLLLAVVAGVAYQFSGESEPVLETAAPVQPAPVDTVAAASSQAPEPAPAPVPTAVEAPPPAPAVDPPATVAEPPDALPPVAPPPVAAAPRPAEARTRPAVKPAPVDPNMLPRLEGESEGDWRARNAQVGVAYQRGLDSLAQREWSEAIKELSAIAERYPAYRETAARLDEARAGLREAARTAVDNGNSLLATDMPAALQQFERAAQYGSAEAAELATRTRERMRVEGMNALKTAKQFDALSRVSDAIAHYERVVRHLPAGDPDRQYAEERLRRLRQ
jgi:predicted component of type VI protein secretion system